MPVFKPPLRTPSYTYAVALIDFYDAQQCLRAARRSGEPQTDALTAVHLSAHTMWLAKCELEDSI